MNFKFWKNKKAFTLVEIVVVVALIGILSAITIPSFTGYLQTTEKNQVLILAQNYYDVAKSAVTDIHSGQFKSDAGDTIKFLLKDASDKVSNVTGAYFISGDYIGYYPENIVKKIGKDGTLTELTKDYSPLEKHINQTVTQNDATTFNGQLKCVTKAMSKYIIEPNKLKMGGIRVGESIGLDNEISKPDNSSSGSSGAPSSPIIGKLSAPFNLKNKSTDTDYKKGSDVVTNILTWEAVTNATSYEVTVTGTGLAPTSLTVTTPSADISSATKTAGDYVVSVVAIADKYLSSEAAILNLHKMPSMINITTTENADSTITIGWDLPGTPPMPSKTGKYALHHKSGTVENTRITSSNKANLYFPSIIGGSNLQLKVRSLGNGSSILSSDYLTLDIPLITITVKNTATTNPTGTFVGRAYAADIDKLAPGKAYNVKLFAPNSTTAYETINFTPTTSTHTIDLTGKFTPTMDGANGTHTIAVYDGTTELVTTTRDIGFYYGNGTYKINPNDAQDGTDDFYPITDPESLQALSAKVDKDNANFASKNYKQIVTVDMTKGYKTPTTFEKIANFTPIGPSGSFPFKGTYDGGAKLDTTGYEIRNITINRSNGYGAGLFGAINGATLKNIGIAGDIGSSVNGDQGIVGAIVGSAAGKSTIVDVYNEATVSGGIQVGGIVGVLSEKASLTNAYNTGDVTGTTTNSSEIAGIAGRNQGSIANVYNTGAITGPSYHMGGISALNIGTTCSIMNAYNTGTISSTHTTGYIGGILSDSGHPTRSPTISNVYNIGDVTGVKYVGGVVGFGQFPIVSTNTKYKKGITVTGTPDAHANKYNVAYNHISEFVNATGKERTRWNDNGQLLNADGTLMGGPNPGDPTLPPPIITVKSTATTNPTGTFVGRAYAADLSKLIAGSVYTVKLFAPNSKTAYETINFTPTTSTHTIDLTGKFTPTMDGANGTHTIAVYDGATELVTTTRDIGFYYGNGTYKINPNDAQDGAENFYAISDPESLQVLSAKVKIDNANFATKNYKQIATVDMAKGYKTPTTFEQVANFTPIAQGITNKDTFRGTYDGGAKLDATGYEIRNLIIDLPKQGNIGLFGLIEGGAILKNIGIAEGSSITGEFLVAGIAGGMRANCSITNVYNKATISGESSVGGIVGFTRPNSSITNAYNTQDIISMNSSNTWDLGGIVGTNEGAITNVYNTGSISGLGYGVGGIVGSNAGSLMNAYNTGTVSSTNSRGQVGGIVGTTSAIANIPVPTISNVYNIANVTGVKDVGGVVGNGTSLVSTNTKYKNGITVTGTPNVAANKYNVAYNHIREFVNATGKERTRWNDNGQLLNADGTLMGGPNPGDPPPIITVKNTATTNPTGTFVGRAYVADLSNLIAGKAYTVKLFAPNSTTAYETINFTPTATTHTLDLTGKFKPTMDGANGTHTITLYDGITELVTTTRDISFYYGNGTYKINPNDAQDGSNSFYAISDPESLQALSAKVKIDNANFGRKNYKQIVTVDMAKGYKTSTTFEQVANFTPIGDQPNPFKGSYNGGAKLDGTGYEIRNLIIDFPLTSYVGLFGYAENATISNIGINGNNSFVKGRESVGGIVGYLNSNCTVRNVYNKVPITGLSSVGGIFGFARPNSFLAEAYNTGHIQGTQTGWADIGGIAGKSYGSIENVYNTGIITGSGAEVGGIIGSLPGSLKNAYNTGSVESYSTRVGGIIGSSSPKVVNVYNVGNVSGANGAGVGGVVGFIGNQTPIPDNTKYKKGITVTGTPDTAATPFNVAYNNISEFVNATGKDRTRWNDKGQLLNADGSVMGGPNPGGQ